MLALMTCVTMTDLDKLLWGFHICVCVYTYAYYTHITCLCIHIIVHINVYVYTQYIYIYMYVRVSYSLLRFSSRLFGLQHNSVTDALERHKVFQAPLFHWSLNGASLTSHVRLTAAN